MIASLFPGCTQVRWGKNVTSHNYQCYILRKKDFNVTKPMPIVNHRVGSIALKGCFAGKWTGAL